MCCGKPLLTASFQIVQNLLLRRCFCWTLRSARLPVASPLLQLLFLLLLGVGAIYSPPTAVAQDLRAPEKAIDYRARTSARVDPTTGALQLQITLGGAAGRGAATLPVVLNYSSKLWRIEHLSTVLRGTNGDIGSYGEPDSLYGARYAAGSASGWTSSLDWMRWNEDFALETYGLDGKQCKQNCQRTVARMFVRLPDGSRHELRRDDQIHNSANFDASGVYHAVDGSRLRYETISNTLFLPDGSRWLGFNNQFIDRHGNTYSFNSAAQQWTDALGRTLSLPPLAAAPTVGDFNYQLPGFNGGTINYIFRWRRLQDALTNPNEPLRYKGDRLATYPHVGRSPSLFQSLQGWDSVVANELFNPVVLHQLVLPTGEAYTYNYNVYGEIDKIRHPAGATETFLYERGSDLSGITVDDNGLYSQANRSVAQHSVDVDGDEGTAAPLLWQYEAESDGSHPNLVPKSIVTAPDGSRTERYLHGNDSAFANFGFTDPRAGSAFDERNFAPQSAGGQMLTRKLTEWVVDGAVVAQPPYRQYRTRNPRPAKTVEILIENNAALAKTTVFEYDARQNLTATREYDYVPLSVATAQAGTIEQIPTGALLKSSETDYVDDAAYLNRQMVGLPRRTRIKDAAGNVVAQSETWYDEAAYPLLTDGQTGVPGWIDPQISVRGNATTVKVWDNTANNGAGNWIVSHEQYDQLGNARKTWSAYYQGQAAGNITEIQYADRYADAVNRNTYAFPTKTISAVPSDGTYGSNQPFESTITYDFNTGLPTKSVDANGLETRTEYDASLRPKKVAAYAAGQQVGGSVETVYGVPNAAGQLPATERFIKTVAQTDVDKWTESWQWFDGLGRTVKSQKKDSAGDVFVQTEYDNMSRPKRVTNPYRAGTTTFEWTESFYDDLGRIWKVKTPDAAEVITTYSLATVGSQVGTVVTARDQALKERRSITNALGQLVRVDEPDAISGQLGSVSNPNQPTIYVYDTLSNLTTVTQSGNSTAHCGGTTSSCSQTRTFNYNSLSRLLSVQNSESGTISYNHDAAGNLLTKTAQRTASLSIKTVYSYDALNRVKTRVYQKGDGTALPAEYATPAVSYFYDGKGLASVPANSKGKLTKVSSAISETKYTAFDALGRVTANEQVTDGQSYPFTYKYNLSGALTEEKYPSGRTIRNNFDADGDLAAVSSRARAAAPMKPYANNFSYTPHGAVSAMQLGNGRWETAQFNNRLQPVQFGLGTTAAAQDLWKVNFEYGATATVNNGNVTKQIITVPTVGAAQGFVAVQNYSYDSLNRLQSAAETINSAETWKQTYTFDRFGNRKFNLAQTTAPVVGAGSEPKVINPEIDPNTNRLKEFQDADSTKDYEFDAAGNMTRDTAGRQFLYDGENKQKEVKNISSQSLGTYFYDGDGKRVKKTTQTETTIFVYSASGKLAAEYSTAAPVPLAQATISYLTNDHLGSPRAVTNHDGSVTSRRDFMPFGEEIGVTTPQTTGRSTHPQYTTDNVRQKFTGYERDNESNLDFAKNRYHNYGLGRFTSPDPYKIVAEIEFEKTAEKAKAKLNNYLSKPQQWNAYVYTINNPLKYTDPTGEYIYLSGSAEEVQKKLERIKNFLGEERFNLIQKSSDGRFLFLNDKGKCCGNFSKFSKIGDTAETRDFSKKFGEILASSSAVRFNIGTEFTYKPASGDVNRRGLPTIYDVRKQGGGGVTVPANESMSGDIEVWVAPNAADAGNLKASAQNTSRLTEDGSQLRFPDNRVVDGHEFGHVYDLLSGSSENTNSIIFENAVRAGIGNTQRRKSEK